MDSLAPKLLRSWMAGIRGYLVAVPLNYALVSWAHMPKPVAYMLVLFCQVSINFCLCRAFVFKSAPGSSAWSQYVQFMSGIGLFRLLDWAAYTALVFVGVP